MIGYLLDTNVASEQSRPQPDAHVSKWLASQDNETVFLSVITVGELRKGIDLLPAGKRRDYLTGWFVDILIPGFTDRILPVSHQIAERWGRLTASRQLAGTPLGLADGQIAATALEHDLTLVTRNVKDFAGLDARMLNPWDTGLR